MERDYATRTTCRACGSADLTPLFSLGEQFVSNFVDEADVKNGYRDCPKCPLDVELCKACTLVQLKHTAPQELLYSRQYWYKSSTSSTMRANLRDVAEAAQRAVKLEPGDVVLDIGSNDGYLLRNYPSNLCRVGVEPADNLATGENYDDGLHLIHDFWSAPRYYDWVNFVRPPVQNGFTVHQHEAKVVTALGMAYDLEDPGQFFADVAKVLHSDGVFIAQLMCLRQTVESRDVGNFAHEHLEYYSLRSLALMFDRYGMVIEDVETNDVNGGSYRLFVRHKTFPINRDGYHRVIAAFDRETEMRLSDPATLISFYHEMLRNAQAVKAHVTKAVRGGQRVFVRGASTKGNVICQWLGLDSSLILGAADVDKAKWGRFMVGTGIPIMSLEAVRQLDPSLMVILPYAFEKEIVEQEKDQTWRKRGGKFLIPIPELRIV